MKLIIYQIRANTMSVTGGALSRQVKKKCFFSLYAVITSQRHHRFFAYIYYTLHVYICIYIHIYITHTDLSIYLTYMCMHS